MKITYKDDKGIDQQLVRSEWAWPDSGNFRALRSVAQSAAEAITTFHEKCASTPVQVTPAEEAEALRKGQGQLEKLIAARRATSSNMLAYDALQSLATRESGPSTGLRAIEESRPARVRELARVQPWNAVNVLVDGMVLEQFAALTGAARTEFLQRLKSGEHSATARALLRFSEAAPELLPKGFDAGQLPAITEAVARANSPEQMAELDEETRAAAVARAAWSSAVKEITSSATLSPDELRDALGESLDRLDRAPSLDDPTWTEFLGAPRNHPAPGAPGEEAIERAARHLAAAGGKVAA